MSINAAEVGSSLYFETQPPAIMSGDESALRTVLSVFINHFCAHSENALINIGKSLHWVKAS